MTRHLLTVVAVALGFALLLVGSKSNGTYLAQSEIEVLKGGQACKAEAFDTEGCFTCLSDGNGGMVKCTSSQANEKLVDFHGPFGGLCQLDGTPPVCDGMALHYSPATTCDDEPTSTSPCMRTWVNYNCLPIIPFCN